MSYTIFGSKKDCFHCHSQNNLKFCSGCRRVWYCSKSCQKRDRNLHRIFCFHSISIEKRKTGQGFLVNSLPAHKDDWTWVCRQAKDMILKIKVHPDDVYLTTLKMPTFNFQPSTFLQICISMNDLETFDFLLKCGAGVSVHSRQIVEDYFKGFCFEIYKKSFIWKWLNHGFEITFSQDVDLSYNETFLEKTKMWMNFGVPVKFIQREAFWVLLFSIKDLNVEKENCRFIYAFGVDIHRPGTAFTCYGKSALTLAQEGKFLLSVDELTSASEDYFNRSSVVVDCLKLYCIKDLWNLIVSYLSNEFP